MDHQTERAFQQQKHVQKGLHKRVGTKKPGKGGVRYYKSVGLGFKTPREAIEGAERNAVARGWAAVAPPPPLECCRPPPLLLRVPTPPPPPPPPGRRSRTRVGPQQPPCFAPLASPPLLVGTC